MKFVPSKVISLKKSLDHNEKTLQEAIANNPEILGLGEITLRETESVPRQVVGRVSSLSKLGMVGSARPRCTSIGRFQAIASCGRTVLYSVR